MVRRGEVAGRAEAISLALKGLGGGVRGGCHAYLIIYSHKLQ